MQFCSRFDVFAGDEFFSFLPPMLCPLHCDEDCALEVFMSGVEIQLLASVVRIQHRECDNWEDAHVMERQ